MSTQEGNRSTVANILAIVGFIIIVAIGLWGAINAVRLAPQLFSGISSPFGGPDTTIDVIAPSSVTSGEAFEFAWEHDSNDEGLYAFSYLCSGNFVLQVANTDGTFTPIACERPFAIPASQTSLRMIALSPDNRFLDVSYVLVYTDSEGERVAENAGVLMVVNPNANNSPDTIPGGNTGNDNDDSTNNDDNTDNTDNNTGTGSNNSGGSGSGAGNGGGGNVIYVPRPVSDPNGTPDLAVRILSVNHGGHIPQHGYGYPQPYHNTGNVSVTFEVENVGTKTSPAWSFAANLPTIPPFTYESVLQQPLHPKDRIEFTLSFDKVAPNAPFVVNVDPAHAVYEISEHNNSVSRPILAY